MPIHFMINTRKILLNYFISISCIKAIKWSQYRISIIIKTIFLKIAFFLKKKTISVILFVEILLLSNYILLSKNKNEIYAFYM